MSDTVYIILGVILVIILYILNKYNTLIKGKNRVKNAKSNIEIYLKKRFDLIPNVVETVKGYSKHEKGTLKELTELRSKFNKEENIDLNKANSMNNTLTKCLAVVEAYPELKANEEYLSLQKQLAEIEEDLEYARTRYNNAVTRYNTMIETVPTNIIASLFAFKKAEWFKTEEETKENVKVEV